MRKHLLVVTLVMTLAPGCARSSTSGGSVSVMDSAGVRVVVNGAALTMPERKVGRALLEIGWKDEEPTFEAIWAGALLTDGSAAVMDDRAKTLYLISADGRNIQTVGRRGEGPGEFQSGSAVEALHGDTIVVYDYMLSRLSLFDARGKFVDSELWERVGVAAELPSAATASGRLAWIPAGYSQPRRSGTGTEWIQGPLLTSEVLGHDVDTVVVLPLAEVRTENGRPVSEPFPHYGASDAFPGGFIWARNDIPEVKWIAVDGKLQQVVRWTAEHVAVDDSIWAEYEAAYYERMGASRERGTESQMAERLREQRKAALPELPLFRFVHSGSDGSAWVSDYTMFGMPARRFTVFSPGGVGVRVAFPRPIMILDVRGDRILGVETDEWGVVAVVVYQFAL